MESRYLRSLVRCAFALLDEASRIQFLGEATSIGAALTTLVRDDGAVVTLPPFARRHDDGARDVAIEICVLRGEVFAHGVRVTLARSEFAILIALGRKARAYSVVELGDLLYPELDADNAANRLRVYVYRIRQRLGADTIVADGAGYRLGPGVDVDLRRLAAFENDLAMRTTPTANDVMRFCSGATYSLSELEAFVFRLRLPETIANELRESLARFRRVREAFARA